MANKTNIFYLSTSLNIGGTERILAALIDYLKPKYDFSVGFLKEKGYIGRSLEEKNIPLTHFKSTLQLVNFLKRNDFRIIHTFLFRAGVIGRIAGKMAKVPVVISSQQAIGKWRSFYHVWLDRFSSRWCDMIIANSLAAKQSIHKREKIPIEKICVVYNGLNFRAFTSNKSREEIRKELYISPDLPLILFVGRLHWNKGVDLLPDIASKVRRGIFLVAGDGPKRESLENKIMKLGLHDRFVLLGWQHDIASLAKASDILVLPSREESFPQVLLEAMYYKLPVIASDIGGVGELVDDQKTGILVQPRNTGGFAEALNNFIRNPALTKEMGEAAYKKCLMFSEERMVKEIDDVYQNLLNKANKM